MSWTGSKSGVWSAERLQRATEAAGVALWSWNVDTNEVAMDQRGHALWDLPRGSLDIDALSARIYPPDREQFKDRLTATRIKSGPYQVDFRLLYGDQIRWINARGLGADEGIVGRTMFGTFMDVTERRLAEEAQEMLATEMSHRVKNLFAIASSLIGIAARSAATTTDMARDLTQRLAVLARAHDLVRRDPVHAEPATAFLGDLFAVFLTPYDERNGSGEKVQVSLPATQVGEKAITALALIVHELATNSIKYGALSTADGSLDVSCDDHDSELAIIWREQGGPPVSAPTAAGFGSKLISRSAAAQLGGMVSYEWLPAGVIITLTVNKSRLAI